MEKTISEVVADEPVYRDGWDWYVKESNRLFKKVERSVGAGALVNSKVTHLSDQELYGIATKDLPVILVVPEGYPQPVPPIPGRVHILRVKLGESLTPYFKEIDDFAKQTWKHPLRKKSEMVYVMWNQDEKGKSYVSVVNQGRSNASVEVQIPWKDMEVVIDSQLYARRNVSYSIKDGWLKVNLDPHAAITFCEKNQTIQ